MLNGRMCQSKCDNLGTRAIATLSLQPNRPTSCWQQQRSSQCIFFRCCRLVGKKALFQSDLMLYGPYSDTPLEYYKAKMTLGISHISYMAG